MTNPAKDAKSKIYGQSLIAMIKGWNKVAIAMLTAQSMKSVNMSVLSPGRYDERKHTDNTSILQRNIVNISTAVLLKLIDSNTLPRSGYCLFAFEVLLIGFDSPYQLQCTHKRCHPEDIRLSHGESHKANRIQPYKSLCSVGTGSLPFQKQSVHCQHDTS